LSFLEFGKFAFTHGLREQRKEKGKESGSPEKSRDRERAGNQEKR